MQSAQYGLSLNCGGGSISKTITRTGDHAVGWEIPLPAGNAGTLTTRTDANTGTVTLAGGHGITTGMLVDIHWAGGVQYGVTVGTVSVNSMPFDLGVGDDLPSTTTAVVVTERVIVTAPINGNNLKLLGLCFESSLGTAGSAHVDMRTEADETKPVHKLVGNEPQVYDLQTFAAEGLSNNFSGDPIALAYCSNGSSSTAGTLKIIAIEDSTP